MIRISKFTAKNDAPEDSITDHECPTVADTVQHFDQEANSIVARCSDDREYLGMLFCVRRANDPVVEADAAKVAPGESFTTFVWEFKGQLTDGPGWRLIFGREPKRYQRPKEQPKNDVAKEAAQ